MPIRNRIIPQLFLVACFAMTSCAQQPKGGASGTPARPGVAQTRPEQPLQLSESEEAKLENLQLKRANLQLQVNALNAQLAQEANDFAAKVLKAHNNPKDVHFDQQSLQFVKDQPVKK